MSALLEGFVQALYDFHNIVTFQWRKLLNRDATEKR